MTQEYSFYDDNYITQVDRDKKIITMDERGGWGRRHTLSFVELLGYAQDWNVSVSLEYTDEKIAQAATNIMLANHCVKHGLDPFQYVERSCIVTSPKDKDIIAQFESLLDNYDATEILAEMTRQSREKLKEAFK